MMKSLVLKFGAACAVAAFVMGCGTTRMDYVRDTGALDPEPQRIWARPFETSVKMEPQDTHGTAQQTVLLGFTLKGDRPATSVQFAFLKFGDDYSAAGKLNDLGQLENLAIKRAIEQANADGLYVTAVEQNSVGLWPFWIERDIEVKGKPVTIVPLGMVTHERYDERRAYELLSGYQYDKSSIFSGGASSGIMGSIGSIGESIGIK